MVGRSLNVDSDPFRPCEEDKDVLGPEVQYLSAIGAFIYADSGYFSDPHKARSQTGYVFLNGGTPISWRSQKQTLVATSSNHAKVIALHEASRECVWLRSMTQLIVTSCRLNNEKSPTIIHEDNAACVAQMKEGYIKSDRTKHIPPRYFAYTQDLIKDNQIEMKYVQSSNNSADLFTKALPTSVFKKHVHAIGMRHNTLAEYMILSGADNHPPMLDKDLYDSWKSRMELYMQNREHGRMILESVENSPLIWPTIEENGVIRTKKYVELSAAKKIQAYCDMKATNIILQGLPADIYSRVNHHRVAKDL
ncbi:retrovirus-related pol polyprotein from transposon TNT 1-94 [Tanacetum coccineum]